MHSRTLVDFCVCFGIRLALGLERRDFAGRQTLRFPQLMLALLVFGSSGGQHQRLFHGYTRNYIEQFQSIARCWGDACGLADVQVSSNR